ncbi:hypothetical protein L1987_21356 [Smallanthus sonchifolius]|uniref:Uncharacterized protein n=1 Tax=Smallanthus sonchifolius TaxID=185202 RepID=A0ACB9IVU2_9ASTR|nr:hypothetical protein L1987_21356 [Smallanthus sonchifolius]
MMALKTILRMYDIICNYESYTLTFGGQKYFELKSSGQALEQDCNPLEEMTFKKLQRPQALCRPPPPSTTTNFLPPPPPPDTSLTTSPILSLTSSTSTIQSQLTNFINTHLKNNFTPNHLLLFLKNHLHHHPKFAHLDLHVFLHAATLDSFRHDHSTYELLVRTLAITHRLDSLSSVLDFIVSNPCPCSDGGC